MIEDGDLEDTGEDVYSAISLRDAKSYINAIMRDKGFTKLKSSDGITLSYSRLNDLEEGVFAAIAAGIDVSIITNTLGLKRGSLVSWLTSTEERSLRYTRVSCSRDLTELAHIRYDIIKSPAIMNIDELGTAKLRQAGLDQLQKGSIVSPKSSNAPTSPVVNISFGKGFNQD